MDLGEVGWGGVDACSSGRGQAESSCELEPLFCLEILRTSWYIAGLAARLRYVTEALLYTAVVGLCKEEKHIIQEHLCLRDVTQRDYMVMSWVAVSSDRTAWPLPRTAIHLKRIRTRNSLSIHSVGRVRCVPMPCR
jgi:hypothetical protein